LVVAGTRAIPPIGKPSKQGASARLEGCSMVLELKVELIRRGKRQLDLVHHTGWSKPHVCRIVNGTKEADDEFKAKTGEVLGITDKDEIEALFRPIGTPVAAGGAA
jgi:hypothetical protein